VLKLTYSNLEFQNFPGEDPGPPLQGEGRGREEEREGKRKGRIEGKDREGRYGKGQRREGGEEWGEGTEGRSTWAPPPTLETSSGFAPATW